MYLLTYALCRHLSIKWNCQSSPGLCKHAYVFIVAKLSGLNSSCYFLHSFSTKKAFSLFPCGTCYIFQNVRYTGMSVHTFVQIVRNWAWMPGQLIKRGNVYTSMINMEWEQSIAHCTLGNNLCSRNIRFRHRRLFFRLSYNFTANWRLQRGKLLNY